MRSLNNKGITKSGAIMLTLVAMLGVCGLWYAGIIDINIPTATDEYEELVNRDALDIGLKIPINIRLDVDQNADTGSNKGTIDVDIKHKHATADTVTGDVVPDAELITNTNYNTEVGNVGDYQTIYMVNGVEFRTGNHTLNQTISSYAGVQYGYSQNNIKVWTTSSVYQPPAQGTSLTIANHDSNHVIAVQLEVTHCRKATQEVLDSYIVSFFVHYKIGDYNEDYNPSAMDYTYYIYLPFTDYAMIEDLYVKFLGYEDFCLIEWKTITTRVREFWGIELFGVEIIGVVRERETTATSNLEYHWDSESGALDSIACDNSQQYGSHQYTYKIR